MIAAIDRINSRYGHWTISPASISEIKEINPQINIFLEALIMRTPQYSSSDEAIATVDENGNVTALKDGKVVITATLTTEYDDEFEDSIEINIPAKEVISNKAEDGTTNGAATQEATSPKTGDIIVVLVSVLMLGAATTLVVTKRRSVKQK